MFLCQISIYRQTFNILFDVTYRLDGMMTGLHDSSAQFMF